MQIQPKVIVEPSLSAGSYSKYRGTVLRFGSFFLFDHQPLGDNQT